MASSLWAEAVSQGRKEGRMQGEMKGRQEGLVADARAFCIELTSEHHPRLADGVVALIGACSDVDRRHEWGLQASRLSGAEFMRLVTKQSGSASRPAGRQRVPRPSRKAKRKPAT